MIMISKRGDREINNGGETRQHPDGLFIEELLQQPSQSGAKYMFDCFVSKIQQLVAVAVLTH